MTMSARTTLALVSMLCLSAIAGSAQAQTYTTFKVPHTGDTFSQSVNDGGTVVGASERVTGYGGFVLSPDGKLKKTDHALLKINKNGIAIGNSNSTESGSYLRLANGDEIPFSPPDTGPKGSTATDINAKSTVVGYYYDDLDAGHAFFRTKAGDISEFDAPGCNDTFAYAVNTSGEIAGACTLPGQIPEGFVRTPDGAFTAFSIPGWYSMSLVAMNAKGAVTGWFFLDEVQQGYVRSAGGNITTFDVPASQATVPTSINRSGAIAGWFSDTKAHGFIRAPNGKFTVLDVPGGDGTFAYGINDSGVVTGSYTMGGKFYGFVYTP
jgi:hypothetical protein